MIGIYVIENLVNGKKYVGKTVNYTRRVYLHTHYLRSNSHCNSHLQTSWNKYGSNNFKFELIEDITDWCVDKTDIEINEYLNNAEINYIKQFKTSNPMFGYNLSEGGDGATLFGERNPSFGKPKSDEIRKKISDTIIKNKSHSGKRNGRYGKPVSDDTRKKISDANKGRVLSDDRKQRISETSKRVWKDNRERMLEASKKAGLKNRKYTDEFVTMIRDEYANTKTSITKLSNKYGIPRSLCQNILEHKGRFND